MKLQIRPAGPPSTRPWYVALPNVNSRHHTSQYQKHSRHENLPCALENDCEGKRGEWAIVPPQLLDFAHAEHIGAVRLRVSSERIVVLFSVHLMVDSMRAWSSIFSILYRDHFGVVVQSHGWRSRKRAQYYVVNCNERINRGGKSCRRVRRRFGSDDGECTCSTLSAFLHGSRTNRSWHGQDATSVTCLRRSCANEISRNMLQVQRWVARLVDQ